MRQAIPLCWLMVSATMLMVSGAAAAEPAAETRLFDGRSLDGWEGNAKFFRVEDGAIVAGNLKEKILNNEFLCSKQRFGDFELRLKCKLEPADANAGIQFRSERIPNHFEVKGYQADMGEKWWGKLYDESRRRTVLAEPAAEVLDKAVKPGDWNEYVIRCEGRHIQLWLNGVQTVDYTEPDETLPATGIIGLQIHGGPPAEARYKDITIKKLGS